MKKPIQSLWFLSILALFLSLGLSLNAQTTSQPAQPPDAQAQPAQPPDAQAQPAQPPQAQPTQPPDQAAPPATEASAQSAQSADSGQSFVGTVVKSGDKYMFKEEATGKTYDIDHQDDVQKFEGKKVKVHGSLDASGKTIHVQ
jgi:hypothetical protein